jgi:hypothetical protein
MNPESERPAARSLAVRGSSLKRLPRVPRLRELAGHPRFHELRHMAFHLIEADQRLLDKMVIPACPRWSAGLARQTFRRRIRTRPYGGTLCAACRKR